MPSLKVIIYTLLFLCCGCKAEESSPDFVFTEPTALEKILTKGTLDIFMSYNTTDYYVYQGVTRGFHYDLAEDLAGYLGVRLRITGVSHDLDTAIKQLNQGNSDLLAVSMIQDPAQTDILTFTQPFFKTHGVLVQNTNHRIWDLKDLDGKEIFIQKNTPYKKVLEQIQDSLHIRFGITEVSNYSYEDLLHLVENGEISYAVTTENIAKASCFSLRNTDCSIRLVSDIPVSWAVRAGENTALMNEIAQWQESIRKNGKYHFLYKRYFNYRDTTPHHRSKYSILKKGEISVFDPLLKKAGKELGWDWKLLAAIVYTESQFNPEAVSEVGAYGLMQVIQETAHNFHVTDYFEPDSNIYVGVQYLKYLNRIFSEQVPDSTQRIKFILAAYNAGPGHVIDAIKLAQKYKRTPSLWDDNVEFFLKNKNKPEYYRDELSKNGYCNGSQTCNYVQRTIDTYHNYKNISH